LGVGCVLCEMLTGRAAFSGKDVTDILAAVIRAEPDWNSLPANVALAFAGGPGTLPEKGCQG